MRFFVVILLIVKTFILFGQDLNINTSRYYSTLSYLSMNDNARSSAFGGINAVSSDIYYASSFNNNPALLNKSSKILGCESFFPLVSTNYKKNNFGIFYSKFGNITFAYFVDYLSIEKNYAKSNGYVNISTNLAYKFFYHTFRVSKSLKNNQFVGIGIKHIVNKNLLGPDLSRNDYILIINTIAFDIGYLKKYDIEINSKIHFNNYFGAALINFSTKIDTIINIIGDKAFLPTSLQAGMLSSLTIDGPHNVSLSVDVAFQCDKFLVPSIPEYEVENNQSTIIKGYDPDVSLFKGMLQSFYDSPEGLNGELKEYIQRIGIEIRINNNQKYFGAIRMGKVIGYDINNLEEYSTVGFRLGFYGFYVDYSRIPSKDILYNRLNFGVILNLEGEKLSFQ